MLVAALEGELDDVRRVETSMRELTELMSLFTMKVSQQTEDVQMIAETTMVAAESVDKGYEELVKAHNRSRWEGGEGGGGGSRAFPFLPSVLPLPTRPFLRDALTPTSTFRSCRRTKPCALTHIPHGRRQDDEEHVRDLHSGALFCAPAVRSDVPIGARGGRGSESRV